MDYAIPGMELVPANVLLCWARSVDVQAHAIHVCCICIHMCTSHA